MTDPAASMMVVVQGRVRLSPSGAEGHQISLGVLGPGEVVGEMALLDGGERSRLDVRLSQRDISTLIGASREKVNKQLRQWEQDGILASDHGYLVISDPSALASAAG